MHVDIQEDEWKLAKRRVEFEAAWQVTDKLEARGASASPTKDNLLWNGDDPSGPGRFWCDVCMAWEIRLNSVASCRSETPGCPAFRIRPAALVPLFKHGGRAESSIWRALWCRWT